jgi:hypothetical protein
MTDVRCFLPVAKGWHRGAKPPEMQNPIEKRREGAHKPVRAGREVQNPINI